MGSIYRAVRVRAGPVRAPAHHRPGRGTHPEGWSGDADGRRALGVEYRGLEPQKGWRVGRTDRAVEDAKGHAETAARHARPWVRVMARFGYVAKGVVYATIGLLAMLEALGMGGKTASPDGALASRGPQPPGGGRRGLPRRRAPGGAGGTRDGRQDRESRRRDAEHRDAAPRRPLAGPPVRGALRVRGVEGRAGRDGPGRQGFGRPRRRPPRRLRG